MDAGSQTFAKLSAAKLLDSAIAAVAASPSTVLSVSCRAAKCAAISLSVMFQKWNLRHIMLWYQLQDLLSLMMDTNK